MTLSIHPVRAAPLLPPWLSKLWPGVALCLAVTLVATGLQAVEQRLFGRAWLEALVLAILLGAAFRTAVPIGARWRAGVQFSAKTLLEIAIVLLGATLSTATLMAVGPMLLVGIILVVPLAIGASFGLGRLLGLSPRMAALVACGNSICGNSAIVAVAPIIGASEDEVACSIAFTAVLGVGVVLGLPLLALALQMTPLTFGAFAGLTVYAVPQVLAATAPLGAKAVQFGAVVKLVRVTMLGPVCFVLAMIAGRQQEASGEGRPAFGFMPWYIRGFLVMALLRSFNLIPAVALPVMAVAASGLTVVSMAGLGLGTDLRTVAKAGGRVSLAVVGSLLVLGAISLVLITVLKIG